VRQGYSEYKPLNENQLKILKDYKKYSPGDIDITDAKVKSKIRLGTVNKDTIKNLKEHYQWTWEKKDKVRYNNLTKKWEKKVRRIIDGEKVDTWIRQKADETKPQFFNRLKKVALQTQKKASQLQSKKTIEGRTYIDNWTKNWLDDNIGKYNVREFEDMADAMRSSWQKHVKSVNIPKGFSLHLSTSEGLPNVTTPMTQGRLKPFVYEDVSFYTPVERSTNPNTQLRRVFFKNKIRTVPGLKDKIKEYFDFISMDKRGMYKQPGGKTIKTFEQILDKDVLYILSKDSKLFGSGKHALFNSFDKEFNTSYNAYTNKVNKSRQWQENANLIEKKLGLKKNSIVNSMRAEHKALQKIFDLKTLPVELQYSIEHAQGLGAAVQSGDKAIMKTAATDLIGATKSQNSALGFIGHQGFEVQRGALMREIQAGRNVESNLKSLNKLTGDAYKDFGVQGKIYNIDPATKKLISKPVSKALTQEQRFAQYFKTIAKTKEGAAVIKKQHGSLDNLLKVLKTSKGPAKFKAIQAVIATVGVGAAASLFDKFGIQPAMADTGAAAPGVTAGDIALAGAAPLATKKGRSLYGKAAKAALKGASTVPGILAIEAAAGPGIVSAMGGSFGEAIASPLLLEGTMRDKRIYEQLRKEGYTEDQIQMVKDSIMLRADTGNVGLESSMIPLQEMEHEGKKYTAGSPELANLAGLYDKAAAVIAKEDEARLERADKFDYLQLAGGGLANLTRTVAPDSGPVSRGLRSLYIDDMD
jgi:hypothetical protein